MTPPRTSSRAPRAASLGLFILTLINLVNYLDRFVVAAVAESLKRSELGLLDVQLGLLQTGFIVVYMVTSPLFGALGDRYSRTRLIAVGVALWSAATAIAGSARSFVELLLARSAVGIGEAAYGTIAPSLLADYYPKRLRGRIFAIFFAAIPIGSALGYVVGGRVDRLYGWRTAFYVAGLPGLLLAILTLWVYNPPRGAEDGEGERPIDSAPSGLGASYLRLFRNGPYLLTVLGYAAYTFAVGGVAFWMPTFLERVHGLARADATERFGLVVVVTGFVGTFAGGWLGDALLRWTSQAYLWLSGVATLLAVPLVALAVVSGRPSVYWTSMVAAQLLLFASTGPVNSAVVNVVSSGERATAVALSIFLIHVLGDVPSPAIIGAISDASSLRSAMLVVPVAVAVAGIVWCAGALLGGRDLSESA